MKKQKPLTFEEVKPAIEKFRKELVAKEKKKIDFILPKTVKDKIEAKKNGTHVEEPRKKSIPFGESRNALMLKAKEKGIKNFRILNKEELLIVLKQDCQESTIQIIINTAVNRWKSGWGSKNKTITPKELGNVLTKTLNKVASDVK